MEQSQVRLRRQVAALQLRPHSRLLVSIAADKFACFFLLENSANMNLAYEQSEEMVTSASTMDSAIRSNLMSRS